MVVGLSGTDAQCVQLVRTVLKVRNDGADSWYVQFSGTKRWCVQLVHIQGFEGTNDYIIFYFSFTKEEQCPFYPKTSLIDES